MYSCWLLLLLLLLLIILLLLLLLVIMMVLLQLMMIFFLWYDTKKLVKNYLNIRNRGDDSFFRKTFIVFKTNKQQQCSKNKTKKKEIKLKFLWFLCFCSFFSHSKDFLVNYSENLKFYWSLQGIKSRDF